ncbi:hypothetical protein VE03_10500, partial [Pseudogymnoascus sp. 23342-1-I1]
MDLKDGVCHRCFLRDTDKRKRPVTPSLMSAANNMDPGTVHKSQGLTLARVVLDINQKEHCLGLSY